MTATAPRRAAALPLDEDDFWGQAPAAVSQPNRREEVRAPQLPTAVEQAPRRMHVPANDAHADPIPTKRRVFQQADVIAPWQQQSTPGMPGRTGSTALNRVAIAAAVGVVALLGIGAAALTFSSERAEQPATPVVLGGDAPAEEAAPEIAAASAAETPAELDARKAQALMEAAEIKPITETAAAEPATAASGPDTASTEPKPAEAAGASSQPFPAAETEPVPLAGTESDEAAGEAPAPTDEMATAALRPVDAGAPLAPAGRDASDDFTRLAPAEAEARVEAGTEETDAATAPSEIELLAATATRTTVKKWVNMRTGPADDAASITVIPADAEVSVISCDGWCQVIYQGEQGWVYKSFVSGAEELTAKGG